MRYFDEYYTLRKKIHLRVLKEKVFLPAYFNNTAAAKNIGIGQRD